MLAPPEEVPPPELDDEDLPDDEPLPLPLPLLVDESSVSLAPSVEASARYEQGSSFFTTLKVIVRSALKRPGFGLWEQTCQLRSHI
ncbi:hypothetical protein B7755_043785 [Streptomyces sp. NBS 14/10]|uniref:hypothetical protein n=1 Tax=Streptomyces sp. NBS 14/10 TaxID=1945643 RepID=UPI00211B5E32|nr:hypothetical protein [Streptomyces sp. NBS 14/10]KAK1186555.1 hypothetical protein B7755_043785 [Streptomyces sp. NBS 14/10]